ncbi:2-hydroxyacylsphingosine 1-beta-galactosyltransferase isoform X1 [Nematostella vectensis]|uniref:2-hydroxyacylsphingosine 1-beta-galactosyltransferase isoform X1 n=2 Tax=Nematostella vectensis TaxID=45351 RepID=UPI0020771CED|nr:2-hydroxyacylsphingosine 1-beta-galactosyltransferase isoform X1 [Nematostella vectensis]
MSVEIDTKMKIYMFQLLYLLSVCTKDTRSSKIVAIPVYGQSHYRVVEKLSQELRSRGHEVIVFIGDGVKYGDVKSHTKRFKLTEEFKEMKSKQQEWLTSSYLNSNKKLALFDHLFCDALLNDSRIHAELNTADLVLSNLVFNCGSLVADMMDIPLVTVSTLELTVYNTEMYGIPACPLSYVPQYSSGLSGDMGVWDRVKNLGMYAANLWIKEAYFYPGYDELKAKYRIKPEKTIRESLMTVSLILMEADFVLAHAQPLPPFVKEVGFLTPSPARPLPADLENFMHGSGDEGVVLVSFSTYMDDMNQNVLDRLSSAFRKISHKVLWKVDEGSYPNSVSDNVKLVEWMPQNDILGHNKTRLFITHAGAHGMAEAGYHGVPVVAMPIFTDQPDNARMLSDVGMGVVLDINTATSEDVISAVTEVITNPSYRLNAARVSHILKSRQRAPVEEAADHVEYVLAAGHVTHLKPRSQSMPFYRVYMLDVMAVLGLALAIAMCVFAALVRVVFCYLLKKTKED